MASAATATPLVGATVASVQPTAGSTVGVGQPIIVTFTGPVANRGAVERSIRVVSPKDAAGHFEWKSDDVVQWKPDTFWPAHSQVKLTVGNMPLDFNVGTSVVGVASISGHTFTVSIDGQVARTMPASMGKPKHPTPVGSFTALAKENPVVMDSRTIGIPLNDPEGYKLTVYYAVRVTMGGVYVHSAPWSVAQQGVSNVSHGCINLSPDNAQWYYNQVNIGDPIIINA
ncbi:MAG TPA: L,D-transpeptidase [Mycobacterium sp.]|nr:L,D-transpeptidase [Mycobacterium sp.]